VEDELGAEAAHRGDLDRVRVLGDADRRLHAEEAGGIGDRLSVVSGRGGDDAAFAFFLVELGDQVDPAPDLEGADRLVVLVLDEHLGVVPLLHPFARLGAEQPPASVADAIDNYRTLRKRAEEHFEVRVPRRLETEVVASFRA
jgi:hypothetical protein